MGLNDTASANRVHIGFFGMRNAGKSSLVNAVTGQELSVVSNIKGTTTDPVKKSMEILPLGPVVIIDTPGLDDDGELGEKRVKKTKQILAQIDIAVLAVDATIGLKAKDESLIKIFKEKNIPYIIAMCKADLLPKGEYKNDKNILYVSSINNQGIHELKEKLGEYAKTKINKKQIVADLINKGDIIVLVIPIDESAPKGRIILPQQMVLREILDYNCSAVVCQATELKDTLKSLKTKPKLVITDSQAFAIVNKVTPEDINLTSFSILFARYKGKLNELIKGANALKNLKDGDRVLISEGCTHHRQCNDIGTVKMPAWIEKYSNAKLDYQFSSGYDFPEDLSKFKLIIHCGGCMINENEMQNRIAAAKNFNVPIVNYGLAIAKMKGILDRGIKIFSC